MTHKNCPRCGAAFSPPYHCSQCQPGTVVVYSSEYCDGYDDGAEATGKQAVTDDSTTESNRICDYCISDPETECDYKYCRSNNYSLFEGKRVTFNN